MINYANSVDCYQIWADMVCYDEVRNAELDGPKYFCVYAGRRDCHEYKHTHAQIMAKYGSRMRMCERIPQALRLDMGDWPLCAPPRSAMRLFGTCRSRRNEKPSPLGEGGPKGRMRGEASVAAREREAVAGLPPSSVAFGDSFPLGGSLLLI
jgi:hypothetical protein